ncbi:MAG TPA: hemerythrin domain-containing protein [Holophagaceae bacterium]|nr:hemerythrin domain-containing protein [Holophagaceae bacterium]
MLERPNFYRAIHKTLRRSLALFLADLGAVNPEDRSAIAATCRRWEDLQGMMEAHAHHEDSHIGAALGEAAPALFRRIEAEHEAHHAGLATVSRAFVELEAGSAAARPTLLQEAYLATAAFMASDFAHMQLEEQVIMPALQATFTDGELAALHGRIVGALSPEERAHTFRLMFPAIHEPERLELLQALRAKLPAEAFEGIRALVASVLPGPAWESLSHRLELAPVVA